MTKKKFTSEVETLKKFFTLYCKEKHNERNLFKENIIYKGKSIDLEVELCSECKSLMDYSIQKLQTCPHETKPRCRTCPNPCYEKSHWKKVAKVMKFSGLKLGLLKLKKFFKF